MLEVRADNQAIDSRFSESTWLTDFITPGNPEVRLKYERLTNGLYTQYDRIIACWQYVANIPYRETISGKITLNGRSFKENDIWLYPAETIKLAPAANCANKSFLLASLLLNELPSSSVHCVLGHVNIDGIGAHAWVEIYHEGKWYILETTLPDLDRAFIPVNMATAYESALDIIDNQVYAYSQEVSAKKIINEHFGYCPIPFLKSYLCERCLPLEV